MNRRRLGYDAPFKPYYFSGCVLWLRADLGITTVDAAVVDGSDLTTAAWTKTNCTATATQITDSNDGVPTSHSVLENAPTALQINHIATSTFDLRAGTLGWVQCWCGDNSYAYVNLATGAIGITYQATASTADLGGGWWRLTMTSTVGISTDNLYVFTANANGGSSYIGNGLGTIFVTNITVTQRNVNQRTDRTGLGHHIQQAVAASRPQLNQSDVSFAGTPAIEGDGVDDFLTTVATYGAAGAATAVCAWRGLVASADAGVFGGTLTESTIAITHHSGGNAYCYAGDGFCSAAQALNQTAILTGTWTGGVAVNGIRLRRDGLQIAQGTAVVAGVAQALRQLQLSFGTAGRAKMGECAWFDRVLGVEELLMLERNFGARAGVPVP